MQKNNRSNSKGQIVQLLAGETINEPPISFKVVYPFKPGIGKNEDSLSLLFKLANKSWLFTGDLGQRGTGNIEPLSFTC
ncbi:hypothetical protein SDC49_14700 [Lactobacillus sp. R2/2]|nr:hypothetical protein [Lactobacillus sp. R2/2]MEB3364428.1 hypothetical protein [Lactobacillus sp. R2/2]